MMRLCDTIPHNVKCENNVKSTKYQLYNQDIYKQKHFSGNFGLSVPITVITLPLRSTAVAIIEVHWPHAVIERQKEKMADIKNGE